MSPTRWILRCALSLSLLVLTFGAVTARAQFFEPALRPLDLSTGAVARSPRLLGMGGLSLAVPDREASLNLWDFAGMPVGLASDDTTSTLDLRPGTDALSSVRRQPGGRERQNLAARSTMAHLEGTYRNHESGTGFGIVGEFSSLQLDRPYAASVEVREGVTHPLVMPILMGVVPKILSGHLAWAAHLRFRDQNIRDDYRAIVSNAAGDYIGLGGEQLPPPDRFTPTITNVSTTTYGLSTAYSLGQRTRIGLGIEHESNRSTAKNDLTRSSSEMSEARPYWIGHAAVVGAFGRTIEYGVDGIGRLSESEQAWRFSTSAGQGGVPLIGSGHLLTREEKSSELRARARWSPGRATFAGSFATAANRITIDPPDPNDATSLNHFINQTFNSFRADTLVLPDSVQHGELRRFVFGWGGGASYRFGRSTLGAELNWQRDVASTLVLGSGPRRITWDVRAGLERPLGIQMKARIGYVYHWLDEDEYTAGNEFKGSGVSLGLGYAPAASSWSLDSGYLIELRNTELADPSDLHQSRQNLAVRLHWAF